jgi:hypothetical protein
MPTSVCSSSRLNTHSRPANTNLNHFPRPWHPVLTSANDPSQPGNLSSFRWREQGKGGPLLMGPARKTSDSLPLTPLPTLTSAAPLLPPSCAVDVMPQRSPSPAPEPLAFLDMYGTSGSSSSCTSSSSLVPASLLTLPHPHSLLCLVTNLLDTTHP